MDISVRTTGVSFGRSVQGAFGSPTLALRAGHADETKRQKTKQAGPGKRLICTWSLGDGALSNRTSQRTILSARFFTDWSNRITPGGKAGMVFLSSRSTASGVLRIVT